MRKIFTENLETPGGDADGYDSATQPGDFQLFNHICIVVVILFIAIIITLVVVAILMAFTMITISTRITMIIIILTAFTMV